MGIGLGLGKEPKTHGELCEAIKNTQERIKEIKDGVGYDRGDEMDLELHLIHLVRVKAYNDKEDELCMVCCNNCGSSNVLRESMIIYETSEKEFSAVCRDCGYSERNRVDKRFDLKEWVDENWVNYLPVGE